MKAENSERAFSDRFICAISRANSKILFTRFISSETWVVRKAEMGSMTSLKRTALLDKSR